MASQILICNQNKDYPHSHYTLGCGGRIRTFRTDSQFEGSKFKWGLIVISGLVRSPAHHWAIWFNLNFATASRSGNKNWNKRKTLISLRWDGYIAATWASCHLTQKTQAWEEKQSDVVFIRCLLRLPHHFFPLHLSDIRLDLFIEH